MQLSAGTRLGPYEVLALIGVGGMGEVYKARDTRLDRVVAIKVSHEQFSERFEREARTVAALNHPHICTLYDVGPNYLVMEHLDGETLAQRIANRPLPLVQALGFAIQIADALAAAHREGVVHRDLKPSNIMLTRSSAKLLDFGLASLEQRPWNDQTACLTISKPGTILGTYQYMAPEQLEARDADARTDIFAFGALLYEMLTGRKAFAGQSHASLTAAIMSLEPPAVSSFQPMTPPLLEHVVKTCLAKDPADRWQTASDLKRELQWIAEAPPGVAAGPLPAGGRRLAYAVAAVAALSAIVFAAVHFREKPAPAAVLRSAILTPEKTVLDVGGDGSSVALSPDGRGLAFTARSTNGISQLYVRSLDGLAARPLANTDHAIHPFWSADSRSIGFFADGKLKRIDASGGSAFTLSEAPLSPSGAWNREGVIVFSPKSGPLQKVFAAGGMTSPVTTLEATPASAIHCCPSFLPDGRHFLYLAVPAAAYNKAIIHLASLDSKEDKIVGTTSSQALYAQGYLLFLQNDTLMAQPFDERRLAVTGEAIPLAEQVNRGVFSVSGNGLLVYQETAANERLSWFERSGKPLATFGDLGLLGVLNFSPDRKALAISIAESAMGNASIWIYDIARRLPARFTHGPADMIAAIWSPDGNTVVFSSNRNGHADLYRKPSNGVGNEELLYADNLEKRPTSWSPDGKFLLYSAAGDRKTGQDLWVLPEPGSTPGAGNKPFPFQQTAFSEYHGQFSPDGRWISYQSDESGPFEIYAAPFRGVEASPGGRRRISTAGGYLARWRRDGKEIFYVAPDAQLMAVDVDARGGTLEVGQVHPLFGPLILGRGYLYDVSADGQRFLAVVAGEKKPGEPLTLVQNWTAVLKK